MSDTVILSLISSITTLLSLWMNYRLGKTNKKVDDYHKEVNSKLSQLIIAEKGVSHAEGKAEGTQEERARQ